MDDGKSVRRDELLASLPPICCGDVEQTLPALVRRTGRKVIVLDDDPTGTQTVHDVPVVTRWSVGHLARELEDPAPASYVLTNSRSVSAGEAAAMNRQIAENLRKASAQTGRDFTVISRSDSTLRGHFPAEMEALELALGQSFDAWVLCPFFEEGGRLTIGDVHYVAEGERLVPAAGTPFAADAAFGYRSSNLRRWVVEKSGGRILLERIESLSVAELRAADRQPLRRKLDALSARRGSVCIVNAACRRDLQSAAAALAEAEARGRRFLYRTAASFVAVRAGIEPRPLLEPHELLSGDGGGVLVVVGSYVPKTTRQLDALLRRGGVAALELDVRQVLDDRTRGAAVAQVAEQASSGLAAGATVVVYTSRELVAGDPEKSLAIGRGVSEALVDVVRAIGVRPRVLVAKGGITSSDVATAACGMQRSIVLGQILPGVPVWRCGPESRMPGMPLVVFPGNVGSDDALAAVVDGLARPT